MSDGEKAIYVTEVVNALGLAKAVDTIVGKSLLLPKPQEHGPCLTYNVLWLFIH